MKIINFPTSSITPKSITTNIVYSTTNIPKFSETVNLKPVSNNSTLVTYCTSKPVTHIENPTEPIQSDPNNDQSNPISEKSGSLIPSTGLVFNLGQNGSWDGIEVGSPVVKRFLSDEEERWFMWYHGKSEKNSETIGLAVSSNGVHWKREQEVMKCGDNWWGFDTKSIKPGEIMIMSSNKVRVSSAVYWMYYTGFSSELVEFGFEFEFEFKRVFKSLPGLAISQDGRNWARIEGDHHSGALFDVGSNNEWDSLFISSPHVVFHTKGDLRMYYHSFDRKLGKFSIGLARSQDGIKWLKLGKVISGGLIEGCFDEMGVINASVVRERKDGKYLMAYEGVAKNGKRSIGLAISDDGLKDWRRVGDNPVLNGSSGDGWDCMGVGSPCLVQMEGDEDEWRLYYSGVGVDGRTRIGMAVSQGNDFGSFRRWVGFRL